jgi:hypothetical protein
MNKTIFIAAMLAVTTVVAAGLVVVPNSVQDAQANPCASEQEVDLESEGDLDATIAIQSELDLRECTFIGNIDID